MKLFKKTSMIPNQKKIEELELELGFTPIVTEENFEREFDRAVIDDYREKHGTEYIELYYDIRRHYNRLGYHRSGNWEDRKDVYDNERKARLAFKETLDILALDESRQAFEREFDPNYHSNIEVW
jgi:hypothetical protein